MTTYAVKRNARHPLDGSQPLDGSRPGLLVSPEPLIWIMMAPIFFNLGTIQTNIPALIGFGSFSRSSAVHVSTLLVPAAVAYMLIRRTRVQHRYVVLLFAYGSWLTLTAIFAAFANRSPAYVFVLQSMLPLFAFVIGTSIPFDWRRLPAACLRAATAATLVSVTALIRGNIVLSQSNSVDEIVPQFKIYFPIVGVVGFAAAAASYREHPRLIAIFGLSQLALVPYAWSRTGFAMALVGASIAFLIAHNERRALSRRRLLQLAFLIPLGGLILASVLEDTLIGTRISTGFSTGRETLLADGLVRLADSPLFGEQFVPVLAEDFSQPSGKVLLYPSHNQYLEFALRGGIPAFAILAIFYGRVSRTLIRAIRTASSKRPVLAIAAGVSVAVLVGSGFNLYLTQPYPACLTLMILGMAARDSDDSGTPVSTMRDVVPYRSKRRRVDRSARALTRLPRPSRANRTVAQR